MASVLVVDDEKNILKTLSRALRLEAFDVTVAGNASLALQRLKTQSFDILLLDVRMPDMDGISLLSTLRQNGNNTPVIMMSGQATIDVAMEATRLGAHDFLEKPIQSDRLLLSLRNCLDHYRLRAENDELRQRAGVDDAMLGQSARTKALKERIALAAASNATVLITGERGTGKELVASSIHRLSPRGDEAFEKINCAAVPENLIESELFGHEAGAFTGATKARRGKFERANNGTLFLDEVGDMPASMQAKLLRVLQEGELERLGGGDTIKVDVRIIAATNKVLATEIAEQRFRPDLYDRLNVLPVEVPTLRERKGDIAELVEHFISRACKNNDRPDKTLTTEAMSLLQAYDFPGNVRELQNLVERLVILTPTNEISKSQTEALLPISPSIASGSSFDPESSLKTMLDRVERELIGEALTHHDGHVTNTASGLGLERSHLYKKMKALGIRKPSDDG